VPQDAVNIVTDPGKARQILINLCGNAVKYTETGEVRLRMRAEAGGVSFEVADTGVGIAAEHLTRIFERFWQVDGAATRAAGGMGIGLAAAREYAHLLRGDVQVTSTPARVRRSGCACPRSTKPARAWFAVGGSLRSESSSRIDVRRPKRRGEAGEKRHSDEERSDPDQRKGIRWTHVEQHRPQHTPGDNSQPCARCRSQ
jgi:signal transduction histidine kinase